MRGKAYKNILKSLVLLVFISCNRKETYSTVFQTKENKKHFEFDLNLKGESLIHAIEQQVGWNLCDTSHPYEMYFYLQDLDISIPF